MQLIANGILAGAMNAMVAIGLGIVLRAEGFLDFAFAGCLLAAAYAATAAVQWLHLPMPLLVPVGIGAAAIVAAIFFRFVYRPLQLRNSSSLVLVLASLGLMVVTNNIVSLVFGDSPRLLRSAQSVITVSIGSALVTPLQVGIIVTAMIVTALSMWIDEWTSWGKGLRASRNSGG